MEKIESNNLRESQSNILLYGGRATETLERLGEEDATMAALHEHYVPVFTTLQTSYEHKQMLGRQAAEDHDAATRALAVLERQTRLWLGMLELDVPSLRVDELRASFGVPDSLLSTARRLVALGEGMAADEAPSYVATMVGSLNEQIARARAAQARAQTALVALQEAQNTCREDAARAYDYLVRIRRHLRARLGPSHRDYRRLMPVTRGGEVEATAEVVDIASAELGEAAEVAERTGIFDAPAEPIAS
jgi:hypothetical protein